MTSLRKPLYVLLASILAALSVYGASAVQDDSPEASPMASPMASPIASPIGTPIG